MERFSSWRSINIGGNRARANAVEKTKFPSTSTRFPFTTPPDSPHLQSATPLLYRLPVEILHLIVQFLPLSSAVALSITGHHLYRTLGAQYIHAIRSLQVENEPRFFLHEQDRRCFLSLLERDCPSYYACQECLKFHLLDAPRSTSARCRRLLRHQPLEEGSARACQAIDLAAERLLFSGLDIHFHDIRQALLGSPASALHAAVISHEILTAHHGAYDVFLDFRISSNSLLLRASHWLLEPTLPRSDPFGNFAIHACPHLKHESHCMSGALSHALQATLADLAEHRCTPSSSRLCRCSLCPTEARVRIKHVPPHGTAVIVTRWLDLGTGRSPYEARWRSHLWHRSNTYRDGEAVPLADFGTGGIAEAFAALNGGHVDGGAALDAEWAQLVQRSKKRRLQSGIGWLWGGSWLAR
ncbi:hypothetical protein MMC26_005323 [Xylographa opegraphella]|nr:hypothetical protein [Xylographa opegraphella]